MNGRDEPTDALVRMKRPDGSSFLLRVPGEHLQRVWDIACGEFGDPSIDQTWGPLPVKAEAKRGR